MAIAALIATGDPKIADDLQRLAAAANAEATVAHTVEQARSQWRRPPLVLVGTDMADGLAAQGVTRRTGVVLVTPQAGAPDAFRAALEVGAQDLAALPEDEAWLVDALAVAAEPSEGRATTVCVIGGRGGAGASVLAATLSLTAARKGLRALLIDGDPLGGGIDLLLGRETTPGARWPDLAGRRGRLSVALLRQSLPTADGLALLSWHRGDADPLPDQAMHTVLDAATRGFDLIVIDLPRTPTEPSRTALRTADHSLVVVPAELRATAAASQIIAIVQQETDDIRLVIRNPSPTGLTAESIATTLDLPMAGTFQDDRRLPTAIEQGDFPHHTRRGSLQSLCTHLLTDLLPQSAHPVPEAA